MTNKSEQDGNGSKTIEISDMKYHIFQVCGSPCRVLFGGGGAPPPPGPRGFVWAGRQLGLAVIFLSIPSASCDHEISGPVGASGSF